MTVMAPPSVLGRAPRSGGRPWRAGRRAGRRPPGRTAGGCERAAPRHRRAHGRVAQHGLHGGPQVGRRARPKRTRTPAPARTTWSATKGWSSRTAASTSGTPAARASHTVLWPPWQTTRSTRRSRSSCGTRGTTRTLAGGSGTRSGGATMTTATSMRPAPRRPPRRSGRPARQFTVPERDQHHRPVPRRASPTGTACRRPARQRRPTSAQWSGNGSPAPTSSRW